MSKEITMDLCANMITFPQQESIMAKRIPLGDFALVDDEDEAIISQYDWYQHSAGYAVTYDPELYDPAAPHRALVLMHRKILGLQPGDRRQIDHINRNRLDNRRENLRIAGQTSNMLNHAGNKRADSDVLQSPYKGVHWLRERQRWSSQFRGKYLGMFDTDLEAALVYDEAVKASGDPYAYLNFPDGPPADAQVQHALRKGKGYAASASRYRGVTWNGQKQRWCAQINTGGIKLCWVAPDEHTAARWYDVVATAAVGPRALLNFPEDPLWALPEKKARKLHKRLEERK